MGARVLQLNLKPKTPGEPSLPKRPAPRLHITTRGVEDDFNDWRTSNLPGDLTQAVLLVTTEVLAQLRQDGWPVAPGDLGENITLSGVSEADLTSGLRLAVGQVVLEITKPCDPCTRLYALPYVGQERGPAFLRTTTGRRGWFARVIHAGTVEQGADVTLGSPSTRSSAAAT